VIDPFRALGFTNVWVYDAEFLPGPPLVVRCMTALNLLTGQQVRLAGEQLQSPSPFSFGRESLFVTYHAPAEIACHRALGWPVPTCVLDLLPEARMLLNGKLREGQKLGLLDVAARFGVPTISSSAKTAGRQLALKTGPLTTEEVTRLLDYCFSDVVTTAKLLLKLLPKLDLRVAVSLRSRYTALAVTAMEWRGVPIDTELLTRLRRHWSAILLSLITKTDPEHQVYDEAGQFGERRWMEVCAHKGISWPLNPRSRRPVLNRKGFGDMARLYPEVEQYRQLRNTLAQLKRGLLYRRQADGGGERLLSVVGADGRARCRMAKKRVGRLVGSKNQPFAAQAG
jgi:hypothetical protein